MVNKKNITWLLCFNLFTAQGLYSGHVAQWAAEILSKNKNWADDCEFENFLKDSRANAEKIVEAAMRIVEDWCYKIFASKQPLRAILLVPQKIYIEPENPNLTKVRLIRDLCKILGFMRRKKIETFVFNSDYLVVSNPSNSKESYLLFAYAKELLKNKTKIVDVEFTDGTGLKIIYDAKKKQWTSTLY